MVRIMTDGHTTMTPTAADLRASMARANALAYCVAARVGIHPTTLSCILNGHREFDAELARRILDAIGQEEMETVK